MADETSGRISLARYRIAVPFAIVAAILFSSCYSYIRTITDDHSAIADPRERWRAYGIQDYEFRMDGYRDDSITSTVRIHVEFGWEEKIIYIDPPRPRPHGMQRSVLQVKGFNFDAMFRDIEQFRNEDTLRYYVEYDERFGYPRYVHIMMRRRVSHDGWGWGVEEPSREYDTVGMHYRVSEFHALELDY